MREFIRPVAAALSIACLAASMAVISSTDALAQAKPQMAPAQAAPQQPPPVKQMALTEKQIQGVLAASKDMDAITAKLPENGQPDAKMMAQMNAVAKKNGFASADEYNDVTDNIGMVMSGIDTTSKKYVGNEAVLKAQIAQIQADKKMSPKDKKDTLAELAGDPEQRQYRSGGQILRPACCLNGLRPAVSLTLRNSCPKPNAASPREAAFFMAESLACCILPASTAG